jgi:Ca-activated chloride channel family protein
MHVTAHLDVDVIAVETADEVSVLVELTAPAAPTDEAVARPQRTVLVVLDRSGSMEGNVEPAVRALGAIVDRLDPTDNFGVVAFDDQVELTVPAGPLADKRAAKQAIRALYARGNTDLSAGYLRGIQEARRVAGPAGATLLLVSDGHANAGVTDPVRLGEVASEAYHNSVVTSTLGWGLGYDERLLAAIASGGSGSEGFAENADAAVGIIAGELTGLLSQTAQAASLLVRLTPRVTSVRVLNDLPTTGSTDGIIAELGSFYSGETRKLLLTFQVPSVAALGLTRIATLELSYVELPALVQHTVNVPLHVNVVPGDEATGRVPDPTVRTELVYQRVQQTKRSVSRHLSAGDPSSALAELRAAQELVASQLPDAPPELVADLQEEVRELDYLTDGTVSGRFSGSAKYSSSSSSYRSRLRGRSLNRPSVPPQPQAPAPDATDPQDD